MKNLFSFCLVAILSLGSTGFTTVEEMGNNSTIEVAQENCFDTAWISFDIWENAFSGTGQEGLASDFANSQYENCLNNGGSAGSQDPVVITN